MATRTPSSSLPRLLCLHGGGVTAEVFRMQSRALIAALPQFRFVFADGPFFCSPGPGIVPVYEDFGPFRRWLRWLPEHQDVDRESAVDEVVYAIENAMREDERMGGRGPWVGICGFSQGAKLAASLLLEVQVRRERQERERRERLRKRFEETGEVQDEDGQVNGDSHSLLFDQPWAFGLVLAGRAPLTSFSPETYTPKAMVHASELSEGFKFEESPPVLLRIPTVHVHGLQDPGLPLHQKLLEAYCEPGSAQLIEWDGGHRVPIKPKEVGEIAKAVKEVAERGILRQ